jgi:prepilin-type N-terminal cleavage/methylation domain-containing protein
VCLRALGDERGFSLLEALIAAAILASALLSLAQLIAFAVRTTAAAGRMTDATLLAAQKVEELRARSWSELQPGTDSPVAGFTRTWTVTPMGADPDYVAILEVLVRAPGGQTRMIALKTRPSEP